MDRELVDKDFYKLGLMLVTKEMKKEDRQYQFLSPWIKFGQYSWFVGEAENPRLVMFGLVVCPVVVLILFQGAGDKRKNYCMGIKSSNF